MNLKIFAVISLSLLTAQIFLLNKYIPLFFLIIAGYIWLTIRLPEISMFILILAVNDFFSMLSENIFRIPGIFRFKDVLLVIIFLVLFFQILLRKISPKHLLYSKAIGLITFFVLIEIFLTIFFQHQGFNYTIRMARRYFYYLVFFPLALFIDNDEKFNRFLKLIIGSAVIYSVLVIIQYILGPDFVLFKFASHIVEYKIGREYVTRTYADGSAIALIVFFIYLFKSILGEEINLYTILVLFLTFLGGIYLKFGRANIFGVVTGFMFSFFILLNTPLKKRALAVILISLISVFFSFEIIRICSGNNFPNPIVITANQLATGADDLRNQTGSFGFRLEDSAERIALIKKHPVFGVGFIHPLSGVIKIKTADESFFTGTATVDSGIITLLLDFGLLGLIWLSMLTTTVFQNSKKLFESSDSVEVKTFTIAMFAYYFSRLFSFLTLADFVFQEGIIAITIILFVLNYFAEKQDEFVNNHRQLQH